MTKENPPFAYSAVVITLPVEHSAMYTLSDFEICRETLQEALQLKFGGMALRTETINLEAGVAKLSLPRQYVPQLLDLCKCIQVCVCMILVLCMNDTIIITCMSKSCTKTANSSPMITQKSMHAVP